MKIAICSICSMDTAGNHEWNCLYNLNHNGSNTSQYNQPIENTIKFSSQPTTIKKIDINKIRGYWQEEKEEEMILVDKNGKEFGKHKQKSFSGGDDTIKSIIMVAKKVNELIDKLRTK